MLAIAVIMTAVWICKQVLKLVGSLILMLWLREITGCSTDLGWATAVFKWLRHLDSPRMKRADRRAVSASIWLGPREIPEVAQSRGWSDKQSNR